MEREKSVQMQRSDVISMYIKDCSKEMVKESRRDIDERAW